MNIVNYMNHFWFQNQYDPCSSSETTLFHYLLFEAERQQWVMPFKLPTQMLISYTGISKPVVEKARKGLQKRGLITYSNGEGKGRPAQYSLVLNVATEVKEHNPQPSTASPEHNHERVQEASRVKPQEHPCENTQKESYEPIQEQTQELTHNSTQTETHNDTQITTRELTLQDTQDETQPLSHVWPISILREKILNDKPWQDNIIHELAKEGIQINGTELIRLIKEFFDWQEQQGDASERDETGCRRHVFNNIRSCLKKRQQRLEQKPQTTESSQDAADRSNH